MKTMRLLTLPIFLLLATGCTGSLPKEQVLDRLRILALVTPTPEVLPGATVTITPLVSDYLGAGRALTYTAEACTDPGVAYGATPSCSHDSSKQTIASTAISLAAPRYTGTATSFTVTVPSDLFTTQKTNALDQYNGINYLVLITITAADGEIEKGFKRIKVSGATKTPKNSNPTISAFENSAGTTLTAMPTSSGELKVSAGSGSAETYTSIKTDGSSESITETLVVSWFSTEDGFDTVRLGLASTNSFTAPSSLSTAPFVLAVLRDGRGGLAYLQLNP